MTADKCPGPWRGLAAIVFVIAACGSVTDAEPASGSATSATEPLPATSSTGPIKSTDGSIVRPERRIDNGPVVEFPRRSVTSGASWTPPTISHVDVNLTVVPATIDEIQSLWEEQEAAGLTLSRCVQVAPEVWILEGSIDISSEVSRVVLQMWNEAGDVVAGSALVMSVQASGPFSVLLDGTRDDGGYAAGGSLFNARECLVSSHRGGPTLRVESTVPDEGLLWDAPAGSVHELGIGADIQDWEDPRRGWAIANWSSDPMPFADVLTVIPGPDVRVRSVTWSVSDDRACRSMATNAHLGDAEWDVDLVQWIDCPEEARIGPHDEGSIDEYPGMLAASYGPGTWVTLYGSLEHSLFSISAPTLDEALALLPHLELRPNLSVADLSDSPYRADELDAAIASTMDADGGVELARTEYEDGWALIARVHRMEEVGEGVFEEVEIISEYTARLTSAGWVVEEGGGGGPPACVHYSGSATERFWMEYVVLENPEWTLEVLEDGIWTAVETANGSYLIAGLFVGDETIENWMPELQFRATDESGAQPACMSP